jgi:hypothetical protein
MRRSISHERRARNPSGGRALDQQSLDHASAKVVLTCFT